MPSSIACEDISGTIRSGGIADGDVTFDVGRNILGLGTAILVIDVGAQHAAPYIISGHRMLRPLRFPLTPPQILSSAAADRQSASGC